MRLSPIAMLSLLSVIPLAANDHDLIEPRANDFDTVHEDDAKARLYQIRDSKDKNEVGNQIIEDAENDAVDPSASEKYALHEQVEKSEGDGDKKALNVEGEVEGDGDGKDGEGSPKQSEKSSEKTLEEEVIDAEHTNADEVSSGTDNVDTNETSESNEIGEQEDDGDAGVSKTGADRADGAEKIDEKKRPTEEGSKPVEIDYANKSTGALILDKSKNFQGTSNLLVADKDKYAMIPCDQGDGVKFVIVGLSEDILVKSIKLSSYERYSSLTKRFQVLGSQTYPVMSEWEDLGTFDAKPWYKENKEQIFDLVQPSWSRYLKFRFLDHYGDEHYCAYTQIKVHGSTTLQGFHEMQLEENEAAEAEAVAEAEAEAAQAVIDEIESAASILSTEPDSTEEVEKVDESVVDVKLGAVSTEALKEGDEDRKEDNTLAVSEPADNSSTDDHSEVSEESNNSSAVVSEQDLPDTKSSDATDAEPVAVEHLAENKERHSDEKMEKKDTVEEVAVQKQTDLVVEDSPTIDHQHQNNGVEKDDDEIIDSFEPTHIPETKGVEEEETIQSTSSSDTNAVEKANTNQSTSSSVINAVKKATMMKDAVKDGINQIMKSKAIVDNEDDNLEQANTDESAESKNYSVSDADSSDPDVIVDSSDTISSYPAKSLTIDPKDDVVEFGSEIAVTAGAGDLNASTTASSTNANANNDTAAREAIKVAEEMLSLLSEQFPSAKCLDDLDFSEFKKRSIDAAKQKASQKNPAQGEKPKNSASKNEPIFKKLTDEIKSLQASQGVYEQYIKSATTCYQRVILDLGNGLVTKQKEQEERMRILEDQMRTFVEEQSNRITAKDLMVTVKAIAAKILSFILKTCPMMLSWYSYLKIMVCAVAETILGNEHVQRIMSLVVTYERDVKTFLSGVLFCYLFVARTKWVRSRAELKKENKRRRRRYPKNLLVEDSPPRDIHASRLITEEEASDCSVQLTPHLYSCRKSSPTSSSHC